MAIGPNNFKEGKELVEKIESAIDKSFKKAKRIDGYVVVPLPPDLTWEIFTDQIHQKYIEAGWSVVFWDHDSENGADCLKFKE